ncbi:hypothetical protein DUI87_00383 [Hirundo rustica rustica]|uniref:Uncharacterized protein n=1 Tax=Hirundo rustica rustica TaxID=333673 RepID=A0A3M0LBH9_HIRRU|nr:hypothetical protein DUI87_00383 [Hirundo rustica rustica]
MLTSISISDIAISTFDIPTKICYNVVWSLDIIFDILISKLRNIDINLWYLDIGLDLEIFNADLDTNLDIDL